MLLILDEVQRRVRGCGSFMASADYEGAVPDIVTLSKDVGEWYTTECGGHQ